MHTFQFMDKYTVQVHHHLAQNDNAKHITIVILPAIGVAIKKYDQLSQQLAIQGYDVIAADYPCCGANQPQVHRGIDYNYRDLIDDFIPQLLSFSKTPTSILLGHSLGGQLASLFSTEHHIDVIGIATGDIHYKNWQGLGQLKILAVATLFSILSKLYGYFPGYKVGFSDKETKGVIQDWGRMVFRGIRRIYTRSAQDSKSQQSQGFGYFISIKNDNFAPISITQALAKLFVNSHIDTVCLPVELKGNPHSVWLKTPQVIIEKIVHKY
ncbi:alpha/beta fold hydrolase [Psychrobacter sp. I-STPA6b]|uniref:alpha/beta fold hydrolase n=1 Tax=Psychrobacter sp. I-STPA6b TaxID=2585718 RepID=UPI001D0C759A|nr:alpha/beta fold hydrolase [Psychrobacter sp. I-STPA6b]